MYESVHGPEPFYTPEERRLVAEFDQLRAFNESIVDDAIPESAIAMHRLELRLDTDGSRREGLENILRDRMVRALGVEPRIAKPTQMPETVLDEQASQFSYSNVYIHMQVVETKNGQRYFKVDYDVPTDASSKLTGPVKAIHVLNQEEFDSQLQIHRNYDARRFLQAKLQLSPDTFENAGLKPEDLQAIARSYVEIERLQAEEPNRLPHMPELDELRAKALRSIAGTTYLETLLRGTDYENESVKEYTDYLIARGLSMDPETFGHLLRIEQANRSKYLQDRVERHMRKRSAEHAIKTVGLTALYGMLGYGVGYALGAKGDVSTMLLEDVPKDYTLPSAMVFAGMRLVSSLITVNTYMKNRSYVRGLPMASERFDESASIEEQLVAESKAFAFRKRMLRVNH